jgi:KaiC
VIERDVVRPVASAPRRTLASPAEIQSERPEFPELEELIATSHLEGGSREAFLERAYRWRDQRLGDTADGNYARVNERIRSAAEMLQPTANGAEEEDYLNPGTVLRLSPFRNAPKVKTTLSTLDDWTEGGIPFGASVGISGPPGTGKTTLAIQVAREARAQHGAAVIAAPYDEGIEGAALKLGQQAGLDYELLRKGDEKSIRTLEDFCLFGVTVGAFQFAPVSQELVRMVANARRDKIPTHPLVLLTDTLQKARFELPDDGSNGGERFRIEREVVLLRDAALTLPALNIMTSEVSRGAYASKDPAKRTTGLAASAESRAIEYGCELLVVLSNRADGLIDVEVAKNRLGRGRIGHFLLRHDRDRALYTEVDAIAVEQQKAELRDRERTEQAGKLGEEITNLLAKHGPLNVTAIRERLPVKRERLLEALRGLEVQGVAAWSGGPHGAHVWSLTELGRKSRGTA